MLTELYEDGHLDILRAIKNRELALQEVYDAIEAPRLPPEVLHSP